MATRCLDQNLSCKKKFNETKITKALTDFHSTLKMSFNFTQMVTDEFTEITWGMNWDV